MKLIKMLITKSTIPSKTSKCTILSVYCVLSLLSTQIIHLQTATSVKLDNTNTHSRSAQTVLVEGYEKSVGYESSGSTTSNVTSSEDIVEPTAAATSTSRNTVNQTGGGGTKEIINDKELPKVDAANSSDRDEVGDADNTTLLIDYDQQGYSLSTSEPATTMARATTISMIGEEKTAVRNVLHVEKVDSSSLNTDQLGGSDQVEPIGQAASKRAAELRLTNNHLRRSSSSSSPTNDKQPAAPDLDRDLTMRSRLDSARELRDARLSDKLNINTTNIFGTLLKKKPYSKFWSAEQKWDDIFRRLLTLQNTLKDVMLKNILRDIAYYADVSISQACSEDLKYVQEYAKKSKNFRWLTHMFDSVGKNEPGLLTGNMASLGHVIQCIKVRAPAQATNQSFDEQYFAAQTQLLGERFRGKYCLASLRPVLPEKPRLISRFTQLLDESIISNISYTGETMEQLKHRAGEMSIPDEVYDSIDRKRAPLDQIPFESELYQFLIDQRNFMYSLPRFMGVCYPSSCTKDDVRYSLQKTLDDQHQVVDIEFDCEVEETNAWDWFNTPRLIVYVFLFLVVAISFTSSLLRYILVDKLGYKRCPEGSSKLDNLIQTLDVLSMDKCVGILFVKTKQASPIVDASKLENNRSTSIDALRGLLVLILVYSELVHLGSLPVPFMWSKWGDSMFPFFRALATQPFLNVTIWSEAFYIISAYLIGLKLLENNRSSEDSKKSTQIPSFTTYMSKRYVRLVLPMICFMILNYVWPRLSNGFVMQDQANKMLKPCDAHGWNNLLLLHNHHGLNETCLWPTHVSASFFQLHLLSYPILLLLLYSLRTSVEAVGRRKVASNVVTYLTLGVIASLALIGVVYSALMASQQELIVPFLIDYIDFDNYRRVIEWTVMPTHNHLTSYMAGISLAYLVAKRRADRRARKSSLVGDWQDAYIQRGSSYDSVTSASTQGLQCRPVFGSSKDCPSTSSRQVSREDLSSSPDGLGQVAKLGQQLSSALMSLLMLLASFVSLVTSWYWNGLGQPMSSTQTFWYMCTTKTVFTISFSYLFYKHFATRRNSSDPWMITRFLVPIGRMSLTVFYTSYLVIWFDLLSSLYQWHPSHYFIFEKFNEIIFMTLILAMFAYGSFEATVKILQYVRRAERQRRLPVIASDSSSLGSQAFDTLFQPIATNQGETDCRRDELFGSRAAQATETSGRFGEEQGSGAGDLDNGKSNSLSARHHNLHRVPLALTAGNKRSSYLSPSGDGKVTSSSRHLSIAEQYKLNAELRANYSFASIGLYESAGATDDLNRSHSSDPHGSRDRR